MGYLCVQEEKDHSIYSERNLCKHKNFESKLKTWNINTIYDTLSLDNLSPIKQDKFFLYILADDRCSITFPP